MALSDKRGVHKILSALRVSFVTCICLSISACALDRNSTRNLTLNKAHTTGFQDHTPRDYPGLVLMKPAQRVVTTVPSGEENKFYFSPRLIIFIEGDGAAWRNSGNTPPDNPTPDRLVPLDLAVLESHIVSQSLYPQARPTLIAYISRPCQFRLTPECNPTLWTNARYGQQAQALMTVAIENLLITARNKWSSRENRRMSLTLIGYSGGGVISALLATSRDDVDCLITLAAPLDIDAWTKSQQLSPLTGSQNPALNIRALRKINQYHFIGENDSVVPISALGNFRSKEATLQAHVLPGVNHRDGWVDAWKDVRKLTCLKEDS